MEIHKRHLDHKVTEKTAKRVALSRTTLFSCATHKTARRHIRTGKRAVPVLTARQDTVTVNHCLDTTAAVEDGTTAADIHTADKARRHINVETAAAQKGKRAAKRKDTAAINVKLARVAVATPHITAVDEVAETGLDVRNVRTPAEGKGVGHELDAVAVKSHIHKLAAGAARIPTAAVLVTETQTQRIALEAQQVTSHSNLLPSDAHRHDGKGHRREPDDGTCAHNA